MRLALHVAMNDWREPWERYIEAEAAAWPELLLTDEDRLELRQMQILSPGSPEELQYTAMHPGKGCSVRPESEIADWTISSAGAVATISAAQAMPARTTHARPAKPLTCDELPHVPPLPPLSAASPAQSAQIEELLTAGDCCELLGMHILAPGCAEEAQYISQHASEQISREASHAGQL